MFPLLRGDCGKIDYHYRRVVLSPQSLRSQLPPSYLFHDLLAPVRKHVWIWLDQMMNKESSACLLLALHHQVLLCIVPKPAIFLVRRKMLHRIGSSKTAAGCEVNDLP